MPLFVPSARQANLGEYVSHVHVQPEECVTAKHKEYRSGDEEEEEESDEWLLTSTSHTPNSTANRWVPMDEW